MIRIVQDLDHNASNAKYIMEQLRKYDATFVKNTYDQVREPYRLFVLNSKNKICGGLIAEFYWGALMIRTMWIEESLRGMGYGKELIAHAEKEATTRECLHILVETASFNNPEFYKRCGFVITGELKGFPEGHSYFFMAKRIKK